jgi:hypothetical protein
MPANNPSVNSPPTTRQQAIRLAVSGISTPIPKPPTHPPDVLARFPSMKKYDNDMAVFVQGMNVVLQQLG